MAILFQMQAGDEQFVRAGDVRRRGRFGRGRRHCAPDARLRRVRNNFAAGAVQDAQQQPGFAGATRKADFLDERRTRRQVAPSHFASVCFCQIRAMAAPGMFRGDSDAKARAADSAIFRLTAACRLACCAGPIFWMGYQILAPRFRLAGLEKAEVGLVVGIDAGHDFDVGRRIHLCRRARSGCGPRRNRIRDCPRSIVSCRAKCGGWRRERCPPAPRNRSRRRNPPGCPCTCRRSAPECWRKRKGRSARIRACGLRSTRRQWGGRNCFGISFCGMPRRAALGRS